jgi:hypothetical protein
VLAIVEDFMTVILDFYSSNVVLNYINARVIHSLEKAEFHQWPFGSTFLNTHAQTIF